MISKTKTALVTGVTSGFGELIAKHLVEKGYSIIVLGRSKNKLDSLLLKLKSIDSNNTIDTFLCDLSSFESIKYSCKLIKNKYENIELFILNAGIWNFKYIQSKDLIEETFQVNLLAPYLIFKKLNGLLPKNDNSKVIFTSSGLHQGDINFSDVEFRKNFSGFKSYRQSKLGIILITRLLSIDKNYSGISFYSVHPGMVKTELGRNAGWFSRMIFKLFGKSKEKGAKTHIYLIDELNKNLTSGEYYSNKRISKASKESYNLFNAKKLFIILNEYYERLKRNESKNK